MSAARPSRRFTTRTVNLPQARQPGPGRSLEDWLGAPGPIPKPGVGAVLRAAAAVLGLLAFSASAAAQLTESPDPRPWSFTGLAGAGVREIDSESYGAALVGFSASRLHGERIELGVEAFVLLPNEVLVVPSPIFVPGGPGGTTQMTVEDIDVAVLFRMNYWLATWRVRPYLGFGAGVDFLDRTRVGTRAIDEPSDGVPVIITREIQDGSIQLVTLFAAGLEFPITDHWRVRPEARVPLPVFVGSARTLGFGVGVSYVR